jgi:murein DD-endopeptidase MepM/ murein hydrolase activator NlpD
MRANFPLRPYPVRVRPARLALASLLAAAGLALGYVSTSAADDGTTTTTTAPAPTTASTATTTTAPTTTAAAPAPAPTPAAARDLDRGCLAVAAAALWLPGHPLPLVVGPAVHAPWAKRPARTSITYPNGGSIVSALSAELSAPACAGAASLQSLSLFVGAVTLDSVTLRVDGNGIADSSSVAGLRVGGALVATPAPGTRVPLGSWGYLEVLRAHAVELHESGSTVGRIRASGLVVHLLERRDDVPAGTDVEIAVADLPAPPAPKPAPTTTTTTTTAAPTPNTTKHRAKPKPSPTPAHHPKRHTPRVTHARRRGAQRARRSHGPTHEPLTVTPKLGQKHFYFPVAGAASFGDTYGAERTDVPGGWHHGDDIFAPLGTPVVAVASGTLNRVGWERLGGWRLWVRDRNGDEFYYAHLSGYTPLALRSKTVRAGQVLGFVGNSGDAFPTTPPHLHFEIHPRSLLRLQYDGAVDPTTYLEQWHHVEHVRAPHPVVPGITTLPTAQIRQEARFIFRELLSDRGLSRKPARAHASRAPARTIRAIKKPRRVPARRAATPVTARVGGGFDPAPLALVAFAAIALAAATVLRLRRPRRVAVEEFAADGEQDRPWSSRRRSWWPRLRSGRGS